MLSLGAVALLLAVGVVLFLVGAAGLGPVTSVAGMLLAALALLMLPIVGLLELADSAFDDDCPYEHATEFCR